MEKIVSIYFAICIAMYVIDVIAVMAIIFVKPLRMWLWKWYCKLSKEFAEVCLAVWPELMGEYSSEEEDKDENL